MGTRHRAQLFRDFEKWAFDERGYSQKTREGYRVAVRAAGRWLEDNRNVSICWAKPQDLKAYLFSRSTNPRSRNFVRQALIAFGDFLVAREYTEINQARALPRLPVPRSLPKALDRMMAQRVLTVARTMGLEREVLVMLLFYVGLRRAELLELEWRNFEPDLRAPDVWLRYTAKGRGGKSKDRALPISAIGGGELVRLLNRLRQECEDARWVFPSTLRRGYPISRSTVALWLNEIGEAAGVKLHPHLFRHTCATMQLDSGEDVRDIQEWLGHESLSTTQIYTKVRPQRLKDVAARMNLNNLHADEPSGPTAAESEAG